NSFAIYVLVRNMPLIHRPHLQVVTAHAPFPRTTAARRSLGYGTRGGGSHRRRPSRDTGHGRTRIPRGPLRTLRVSRHPPARPERQRHTRGDPRPPGVRHPATALLQPAGHVRRPRTPLRQPHRGPTGRVLPRLDLRRRPRRRRP